MPRIISLSLDKVGTKWTCLIVVEHRRKRSLHCGVSKRPAKAVIKALRLANLYPTEGE